MKCGVLTQKLLSFTLRSGISVNCRAAVSLTLKKTHRNIVRFWQITVSLSVRTPEAVSVFITAQLNIIGIVLYFVVFGGVMPPELRHLLNKI